MRIYAMALAVIVALGTCSEALAWGDEGHSIVGEIAQRRLSEEAQRVISDLIGTGASLASISNWADDERARDRRTSRWHFVDIPLASNDYVPGRVEDYVLDRAQTTEKKMSVFQGPIFRNDDPWYGKDREGGPWQIPLSCWKIAVLEKKPGTPVAAAFIIGQTQYVSALYEAKVFSGLRPYRLDDLRSRRIQTTIKTIEQETGLDFTVIRRFDAHGSLE